jgi:hypothetical protein
MRALVFQALVLCAGIIVVAILDGQTAIIFPLMKTDISYSRALIEGTQITIIAFDIVTVATIENILVFAEAEIATCQCADIFRTDFIIITFEVFMATSNNLVVLAKMVHAIICGTAVPIVATTFFISHATPGTGSIHIADSVGADIFSTLVFIKAIGILFTTGKIGNWSVDTRVSRTAIERTRRAVITLEISHTTIRVRRWDAGTTGWL